MTEIPTEQPAAPSAPEDWVPVEQRILGIDKRTIAPALAVLLFAIVVSGIVPAIADRVGYDEPIRSGDVMDLGGGGQLRFVPAVGWNRTSGRLVGEEPAAKIGGVSEVAFNDIVVSVTTGTFEGTPDELLDQINAVNDELEDPRGLGNSGARQQVTTESGLTGVAETFTGLDEKGVTAAFVVDVGGTSVGVQVIVRGSVESIGDQLGAIDDMLNSIENQSPQYATGAGS